LRAHVTLISSNRLRIGDADIRSIATSTARRVFYGDRRAATRHERLVRRRNPLIADLRNFYNVEKRTQDGMKVDSLLYAGNNLSKAQEIFANAINHRPRIRLTIRRRTRVLQQWRS
jgi:hypothetical protein